MIDLPSHHDGAGVREDARLVQHSKLRAVFSILLGALVIFGAGFAPGVLHGHSHDSRHTLGFVCH